LRLAIELKPRLGNIGDECVAALLKRFPDAYFEFYPERRS
jgi:hypothetical protein